MDKHELIFWIKSPQGDSANFSQYIGCYKDNEFNHAMTIITSAESASSSVGNCLDFCRGHKYTFSALKEETECHCGEHFTKHGSPENCNADCTEGNGDRCSGALKVYATCPIGSYGTNCELLCPYTCSTMTKKMCHVITGKCCNDSQSISYCNFYDMKDCGILYGDKRKIVKSLYLNAGPNFNLFKTDFPHHAEVTEIRYNTKSANNDEFLSIWRPVGNDNYMMVAKLTLHPTYIGNQTLPLDTENWIHVQKGDVFALHYPSSNTMHNMIPYADAPDASYSFASFEATGDTWNPGDIHNMPTITNRKRAAAILLKYNCINTCSNGMYGADCGYNCHNCTNSENCHFVDGTCPDGCAAGYKGFKCDKECDDGSFGLNCTGICGNCTDDAHCNHINGDCEHGCKAGYKLTTKCKEECDDGSFGLNCIGICGNCTDDAPCNGINGDCEHGCQDGYKAPKCTETCDPWTYGSGCSQRCGFCKDNATCYFTNGRCNNGCEPGYMETNCKRMCDGGYFGQDCVERCGNCKDDAFCNHINGGCELGCKTGYKQPKCKEQCDPGTYGFRCSDKCGFCKGNETCDFADGYCNSGCEPGYMEPSCIIKCHLGNFGDNCSQTCENCNEEQCDHRNGTCLHGCEAGYQGDMCNITCPGRTYGMNCLSSCGNCKNQEACDHRSGECPSGCEEGYETKTCDNYVEAFNDENSSNNAGPVSGGIVAVLLVAALAIVLVILVIRKRSQKRKRFSDDISQVQHFPNVYDTSKEPKKDEPPEEKVKDVSKHATASSNVVSSAKPKPAPKPPPPGKSHVTDDPDHEPKSSTKIQIGSLGSHIRNQMNKEEPLNEEYELLPKDQNGSWEYSGQEDLKSKNRYKNIMPYDDCRVILPVVDDDPLSDYINASFIKDYKNGRRYIASHGPNVATIDDFWRMIWEYQVEIIVMLTNFVEQMRIKCDQYWPSSGLVKHGGVTITLEGEEVHGEYITRHIKVKKNNEERKIRHYHFTNWPDKGVPSQSSGILALRKVVQNYRKRKTMPVLVHCSAGVGRTGTFIAIDWLLDQSEQEGQVDVLECVQTLRKQRVNMVQTLGQYKFVYCTILEATSVGITQINTSNFLQKLEEIQTKDHKGKSQMEKEFKYLEIVKPNTNTEHTHVGRSSANKDKNRDMEVIPDETSRIILPSSPSTYVNAVHVKGYKDNSAFIATQVPLTNTSEDFWQLLVDFKCRAIVTLEDVEDDERWFPEPADQIQVGEFMIRNEAESKMIGTGVYDLVVEKGNMNETEYANVDNLCKVTPRLFLCTSWRADKNGAATLKNLCAEVQSWLDLSEYKNVAVLCRNGASKTGLFIACSNLFNMASNIQEVNVMEVVKTCRKTRPQFVSSMKEYAFLYEAVAIYLEGAGEQTYANL